MSDKEHNPDNLTPEQVGDGWRLITKEELRQFEADPRKRQLHRWSRHDKCWIETPTFGDSLGHTYRITNPKTPTPRTDERTGIYGYDDAVDADFARTLERENQLLRKAAGGLAKAVDQMFVYRSMFPNLEWPLAQDALAALRAELSPDR